MLILKKSKKEKSPYTASVAGNTCLEMDMLSWRKITFQQKPKTGDLLIYINTTGYQMDTNESEFYAFLYLLKLLYVKSGNLTHGS